MKTLTNLSETMLYSLKTEEKPAIMWMAFGLLVLLLHSWLIIYLQVPEEKAITEAKPLIMDISLVSEQKPKPAVSAPKVEPPKAQPAKPKQPPAPKKIKPTPKPVVKEKPPIIRKPSEIKQPAPAQASKVAPPVMPAAKANDSPSPAITTPSTASQSSSQSATGTAKAPAPKSETFVEANYKANYGFNPKPQYPRIALNRRWQGKVLLRVQVSAQGASERVSVHRSSGHETLDEAAVEAVKKWKFIPAKRGDKPVASSVIVPMSFVLPN